jgi:methionyl-tRNA formyltransferase
MNPDYIFVAGWSELLSDELIHIPVNGTIGFHPAKLPCNRGRSVLAWQIEEGYTENALTMFFYTDYPDGGDIIAQECFKIEENDYIADVLKKVNMATYNLMYAYFPLIRQGLAQRKKQCLEDGNFRRLRTTEIDSQIDWNHNSRNIYNKIRAISKPYPGAEGAIDGINMKIWRSEVVDFPYGQTEKPGAVIARLYDNSCIIKTRDGFLRILESQVI